MRCSQRSMGRHREPSAVEADAPAAGLRRGAARVDGTSEYLFAHGLCLPSGSALTDAQVERVVTVAASTLG